MNIKNFKFFISFIFLSALLLSGCATDSKFGKKKFKHNTPLIKDIIFSSEIYIPIIGFLILLVIGIIIKNVFYKN